jgi:hypothetical protein
MKLFNFEEKKAWVIGLLFDCPLGKALDECPAKDARSLPPSGRMELVRSMEPHQIDLFIVHHQECLCERELR